MFYDFTLTLLQYRRHFMDERCEVMNIKTVLIYPVPPFDFPAILRRVADRPLPLHFVSLDRMVYQTILRIDGDKPVPVRIQELGSLDKPKLEVSMPNTLSDEDVREVERQVKHMFETDLDVTAISQQFSTIPELAGLFTAHRGLRRFLEPNPFESLIRTIIGQQLNVSFAATLTARLVTQVGEPMSMELGHGEPCIELYAFPTPAQLAKIHIDELLAKSFSRRKAEYIIGVSESVQQQTVDMRKLATAPDEEVFNTLLPLRGIGRWSIECLLLFAYGHLDMMPAGDVGVRNAIKNLYQMDAQPDERTVRNMAEAWAPYRSYASYYLWQSLMN